MLRSTLLALGLLLSGCANLTGSASPSGDDAGPVYSITINPPYSGAVWLRYDWSREARPVSLGLICEKGAPLEIELPGGSAASELAIIVLDRNGIAVSPMAPAVSPRRWGSVTEFDPNWLRACHSQLWTWMTKQQVRFALGRPAEVRRHDLSPGTVEEWVYWSAREDGLGLERIRVRFNQAGQAHSIRRA